MLCKVVHYCGKACQTQHWALHKKECQSKKSDKLQKDDVIYCTVTDQGTFVFRPEKEDKEKDAFFALTHEDQECSICLDPVNSESSIQLPCGHWYHRKCIKDLRAHSGSKSCPNCRESLPLDPKEASNKASLQLGIAALMAENGPKDTSEGAKLTKSAEMLLRQAIDAFNASSRSKQTCFDSDKLDQCLGTAKVQNMSPCSPPDQNKIFCQYYLYSRKAKR